MICDYVHFFFFKQKTAYEMRISDWSSDVCSSDLIEFRHHALHRFPDFGTDMILPIDHARYGLGGNAGAGRDVLDRDGSHGRVSCGRAHRAANRAMKA